MTDRANPIPEWLQNEVAAYDLDLVVPPRTVLDIGANIGAFTLRAKQRWPECRVMAYEPVPASARQLGENCATLHGVFVIRAAVRAKAGSDSMFLADMPVAHSFHRLGRETKENIVVDCESASSIPPHEFIKIDTEGCELEILEGGLNLTQTRALVVEYHRAEDRVPIQKILEAAGLILVENRATCARTGLLKYARPGALRRPADMPANPIPDDMRLTGNAPDGSLVTVTAYQVRHPFFRPNLHGKKLFLGVPVYSEQKTHFSSCLSALQSMKPLPIELHYGQGDGVARCRNQLTAEFLRSDCTHMLMIDSDILFSPDHVARIVSHDVPVVAGAYPKKQEGKLEWVINTLPQQSTKADPNGLLPVQYVGTGFICVRRDVFEQMRVRYPESSYLADYGTREKEFEFWPMRVYRPPEDQAHLNARELLKACESGVCERSIDLIDRLRDLIATRPTLDPGRYLSEDWYFCQRWLDMGGTVYLDTGTILKHIGPAVFPLQTQIPQITAPDDSRAEASSSSRAA
jgi:FkbM family methyltransferase